MASSISGSSGNSGSSPSSGNSETSSGIIDTAATIISAIFQAVYPSEDGKGCTEQHPVLPSMPPKDWS
ncbi:MAG: hypothetical protein JXA94_06895 [Parachlamydiales bacterium]|nr:hypothetical protein [Parachlamydiales bacterium]